MTRKEFIERLALSERRFSRGSDVIVRQRRLINKLKLNGHHPELLKEAERLLVLFEEMQRLHFSAWRRLADDYNSQIINT